MLLLLLLVLLATKNMKQAHLAHVQEGCPNSRLGTP
jgi:hypothetical protein